MDTKELLAYAFDVVAIPALIACLAALPALIGPFRTRRSIVEMSTSFALALAFLLSFVRELNLEVVSRQFPWSAVDADAPIERWHRLAMIAVGLAMLAPCLSTLRAMATRGMDRLLSAQFVVGAALLIGLLVEFPEATPERQCTQAVLCAVSAYACTLAGSAALWIAAIVFGALAAMSMLSGCASFAVMSTATGFAAAGMATLAMISGWRTRDEVETVAGGAFALVAGVLLASTAMAGRAYDMMGIPAWAWIAIPCLPFGALVFHSLASHAPSRASSTFWRTLGVLLVAVALLLTVAMLQPGEDGAAGDDADPMDGIYGS
ncbi:MAG: hypothetical protein EXS10_10070 [Phycisphaerales bacterium]|nr:hypothetical protein [Phycisphaerales bacterium]